MPWQHQPGARATSHVTHPRPLAQQVHGFVGVPPSSAPQCHSPTAFHQCHSPTAFHHCHSAMAFRQYHPLTSSLPPISLTHQQPSAPASPRFCEYPPALFPPAPPQAHPHQQPSALVPAAQQVHCVKHMHLLGTQGSGCSMRKQMGSICQKVRNGTQRKQAS